jgi:thiol-disulfide isomerase/thioredoxin
MTARLILPILGLSLVLAGVNAQETPTTPPAAPKPAAGDEAKPAATKPAGDEAKPPARETPPDQKAYNDISKITDPAKKIEGFEKFKKDFPDSAMVQAADAGILSTLANKMPEQTAKIRTQANAMYKAAVAKDKENSKKDGAITNTRAINTAAVIAMNLLGANIMLKDAESWSKKSVDMMKLSLYLAEQRVAYTKRKQNVPSDEELTKRFKEMRASRLSTFGRVELKLGKTAAAKKILAESYGVNNGETAVAAALGEIAAKEGDNAKALDYLMTAKLSGRIPDSANAAFESVYKKQHNGTLDGLDAALDAEYTKRFPNPVKPEAYKPTDQRTDRIVLGEVFTGAGCPPCVAADLAFDAAMERYGAKNLTVVMYHQHIPRPDPMTNPDTQARAKSYAVSGVPTFVIDGKKTVGGGGRDNTKNRFDLITKDIDKDLDTASEAHIKVDANLTANAVKVAANVTDVKSDSKDLKVQILLVEKELRYTGENGVRFHPMVVRAMGGEKAEGYTITANGSGTFDANFDLEAVSKALKAHLDDYEAKGHRGETFKFGEKKFQINRNDLAVVVFVQDDKTKHVLQAAYVDLGTPAGTRSTNEAQ